MIGVERSAAAHDPRQQEWFSNAWQRPGATLSDAFVFPATGRPGLTVSHRVATDDGVPIAVVGADVELDALAALLDSKRIGRSGVIFLIDEMGRVICHNRADLLVGRKGDALALNMADNFADPVVARSVALWKQGGGNRFVAPLGPDGEDYIVDLTPFPDDIGKRWTVAVAVDVEEFIGPIRQATTRIVVIGTFLISLVIMTVLWLSHQLTQPMRAIVAEADRIRHFDLDGPTDVRSRLVEIDDLARSVDAMKSGLRSFGAYVPKALVRDMIMSGSASRLGGDRRHLTLLFTDIKGFTATSESMPPEEVMIRLSRYFHDMTTSIHDHGGTVDKFIGDAIMAFWNAPRPDENHAENACLAALGCLRANRAIDDALAEAGQPPMPTRFGLHTGEVVVGNVGSSDRMQYTALGSNVNLASRVESLNKQYGTQALVTGAVERIARHRFVFRQVDLAIPSGLSEPIALFELIGARDPESPFACPPEIINRCLRWQDAMDLYLGRRWRNAEDAFRALAGEPGNAVLSALYLDRCARLLADPPGDDWDGAERFHIKMSNPQMKKATKGNPLRTLLAACAALSIMMGGVASAAEKVIKLAHPNRNDAFDNPSAAMAVVFKNLVEAATNRTVRVEIFPEGQLGRDADIVQLVRKGAVQSAISSAGGVAPIYPLISVMDLPFAYRSISTTYAVLDGPFGQKLAEDIRRKTGVAVLGFGDPGGFFAISNSKRTIKSPEDMKGLKIRTMDLETHKTIVGTLGGEPISIAWSEVYTALGTGAADGQMNPIPIIRFARFEEVQSYLTLTNHLFLPYVWVINGKFLDELSAEERTAVLNAASWTVSLFEKTFSCQWLNF